MKNLRHRQELGHDYVRPEHLILALLDEPHELAGQTLAQLGVTPARARDVVKTRLSTGDPRPDGSLGVAPQTKPLLELARAIAKTLCHNRTKTEHILLAAISPKLRSPAASLLDECGAHADQIRDQLTRTPLREPPESPTASATGRCCPAFGPDPSHRPKQPIAQDRTADHIR
jgi:ATP-dependent Clp protease ATP-binding subunit ClpA